jgi:hypothetical protein
MLTCSEGPGSRQRVYSMMRAVITAQECLVATVSPGRPIWLVALLLFYQPSSSPLSLSSLLFPDARLGHISAPLSSIRERRKESRK